MTFRDDQVRRYSRQMLLPEVGGAGQRRLRAGRVVVVGLGGLGSPAALYLAAAGVGTLGVVDHDRVELSNLQRQVLHGTKDVDRPKVASAQARLEELNPDVRVVPHAVRVGRDNAAALLAPYDVVVEGSDDLATKLAVNDACLVLGRPLVVAGVVGWDGQLMVVSPGGRPCFRCVCRGLPADGAMPTCASAGILGPVAGVMGSLQAVEALRLLLGRPGPRAGRLLCLDAASGDITTVNVRPDPACRACGGPQERPA